MAKPINEMEKVKIEVWSDVVCPSCYIGMQQLKQAVSSLNAKGDVEIVLRSFQLDPDFPKNKSMSSLKHLAEMKGLGMDRVQEMCVRLVPVGKKVHIDFKFDEALIYNTQDAHRLIQWSKTFDKSIALEKALLHAYFCDGIDLSKQQNLLKIIEDVGLDCEKAKEIIEKEEFSEEINLDIERAKSLGVRGVPFFLINEKTAVSGYQEDGEFEKLLSSALSR